jgi:hypothetical protein
MARLRIEMAHPQWAVYASTSADGRRTLEVIASGNYVLGQSTLIPSAYGTSLGGPSFSGR